MKITIIIDDTPRGGSILLPSDLHHPRDRMRNLPEWEPKRMTEEELKELRDAMLQAGKWHNDNPQPRRRAKQRRGT